MSAAGAESASASMRSSWRSAYSSAIAPPMLWPSRKSGTPGTSSRALVTSWSMSATAFAMRSMTIRSPSERPWPRRSIEKIGKPAGTSRSTTYP